MAKQMKNPSMKKVNQLKAKEAPQAKKRRRVWSTQEENDLNAGIDKHGAGKWKEILTDNEYSFDDRTVVNLKDKFRSMKDTYTYTTHD